MKEISLDNSKQFIAANYPEEGIYHNIVTKTILICNKKVIHGAGIVCFMGEYDEWIHLFEGLEKPKETKAVTGTVSETFALRLVAILKTPGSVKDFDI